MGMYFYHFPHNWYIKVHEYLFCIIVKRAYVRLKKHFQIETSNIQKYDVYYGGLLIHK